MSECPTIVGEGQKTGAYGNMKLHFTPITLAIALVCNLAWLVSEPTRAIASQEFRLSPSQANRLSRDLATPSPSQNFFHQGRERMEMEIRHLLHRQNAATEPPLKMDESINEQLERIPQLQPSELNQPAQER